MFDIKVLIFTTMSFEVSNFVSENKYHERLFAEPVRRNEIIERKIGCQNYQTLLAMVFKPLRNYAIIENKSWCQRYQTFVATVFKPLRNNVIIERFWRVFLTKNHDKNPCVN